ncbi:MAG: AtpZ/AtpI family protein [Candidatus Goldbacteria bacterium]|nr:AtpZ/AtpI family protein [Candidatus Goldiibacteriota bacterium]
MKKNNNYDNKELFKSLGTVGTLGFTLVLSTFTGLCIGLVIDRLTGLKPIFTIFCLIFGIVAGFVYIYVKLIKNDKL